MYLSKYSLFSEDPCPSSCFLPFFPCHWWYSGRPTLTYQYWPYTTSSPPNSNSTASQAANQSFLVTFFCVAVITRGSWRSNSCRPILSWRPLEMLRPSKMTTPQDLWVLWSYSTHCLDVFLVIFFARIVISLLIYLSHRENSSASTLTWPATLLEPTLRLVSFLLFNLRHIIFTVRRLFVLPFICTKS